MSNLRIIPQQLLALALAASMLTGCAVFVPTVKPDQKRPTKQPVSLQDGIDYAESAKDAYQSALRSYGLIPNILALTLIPLAAATLGLGITGANTKAVTELGLITGTGLAYGSWFQNKPRERVYNAGFQAVTCLLQSIKPLRLVDPDNFRAAIVGPDSLTAHRAALAEALEELKTGITIPADPTTSDLKQLIDEAHRIHKKTKVIERDGNTFYAAVEGAGEDLVQNVDQIIGKVNDAVLQTEPDVKGLSTVISGISVVKPDAKGTAVPADANVNAPGAKADPAIGASVEKNFESNFFPSVQELLQEAKFVTEKEGQVDKVVSEMEKVLEKASIVQAQLDVTKATIVPDMATCMAPIDAALALKVIPDGDVEVAPGQTVRIGVVGGKPAYTAKWLTDPVPTNSITATPKMEGGSFYVEVVALGPAKGGPYQLHIADSLSIGKIVKVTVKTVVPAPAAPTTGATAGAPSIERSYSVKVTYTNANGETPPSTPDKSQPVPANQLLTVTSPSKVEGVTGYNVYVRTATGTATKQTPTPLAIGKDWTEPASGLITGQAPPTVNTATTP